MKIWDSVFSGRMASICGVTFLQFSMGGAGDSRWRSGQGLYGGEMKILRSVLMVAMLSAGVPGVRGQAPGVPIEQAAADHRNLLGKLGELREKRAGLGPAAVAAGLAFPEPAAISLPPCRTTGLRPAEVWQSAQASRLAVGWHYLCRKCDRWHLNLAGGYPVAEGGVVATCYHVASPPADMREGQLVVVDAAGVPWPVVAVLAASEAMDACLLRAEGLAVPLLPLNDQVRPGDPAYLLSSPLNVTGYFTDGMVNRFFWSGKGGGEGDLQRLRMHVSTDWAPGSSGSPVLDASGNAISHVATITHLGDGKNSAGKGVAHLTLHEGIPARGVLSLVRQSGEAAARPAGERILPTLAELEKRVAAKDYRTAAGILLRLKPEAAGPVEQRKMRALGLEAWAAEGNEAEAAGLAELLWRDAAEDAVLMNEVAWKLVTRLAKPGAAVLAAAEKCARRSVELQKESDPASLDTLARVCFLLERREEAVRLQEEAVARADGTLRAALEKSLADYRAGKLPEVKEG